MDSCSINPDGGNHQTNDAQSCSYNGLSKSNNEVKCPHSSFDEKFIKNKSSNQQGCSSESLSPISEGEQLTPTSTRISSSIKRTGTAGTWLYPSIDMFKAAIVRKAEMKPKNDTPSAGENALEVADINSLHADTLSAIVHIHNIVNEQAWQQILKYEKLHNCPTPSLTSFHGKPNNLTIKARLWGFFGYSKPFDRHDWFVDRCGCSSQPIKYIIDFYEGQKKLALINGEETHIPSIYLDVRPAPSIHGLYDRFRIFINGPFFMVKPVISSFFSTLVCIYSGFGVILLTILGLCYQSRDPQFFHSKPLSEADAAALNCFLSALIFLVLFSFAYWQYHLNARMTPILKNAKNRRLGSYHGSILISPSDQLGRKGSAVSTKNKNADTVYSFASIGNMAYNNRKSP